MKILLINQTFYPDVVATAQQLTDFAVDLASQGHEVTVLAARRGYSAPHTMHKAKEIYQGVKIIRVWPFTFGRKTRLFRIIDFTMVYLSFSWKLLRMGRFDRVVALTTPPLIGWIALLFARLRRSKFIYWMMDINPDQAIEMDWIRSDSPRARILRNTLKFTLRGCDRAVVLDRFMQERIIAKGAEPSKIYVNPPWSHDEDLETISHEKNPFREKYNLRNKFVVMYSGNHSICHPLTTLLEGAVALRNDPSVVFMFIGAGERVDEVTEVKESFKLHNVIQLPYQERENLRFSLSAADLHVVVMGTPYVGIVHACKIYGILKIGRPFVYIGPEKSHIGDIILREKIGYHVNHGESEKLVRVIYEVRNLYPAGEEIIRNQEQIIAEKYSRHTLSARLSEIILQN